MKIHKLFLLFGILAGAGLLGITLPTHAASQAKTFNVNYILDEPDSFAGDGKCESAPSAKCTLRAAIQEANASPGADTIVLPANNQFDLTRIGEDDSALNGDLDISDDVTIVGGSRTTTIIDGKKKDRVFDIVSTGRTVVISDLTIQNGKHSFEGGGIAMNNDTLILARTLMKNNFAGTYGGALLPSGTVNIIDSEFAYNAAPYGGVINSNANLTILHSYFHNNAAANEQGGLGHGGALYLSGSPVRIVDSTFLYNDASSGGAIYNRAPLDIVNSTIGENHALGDGGGIYNLEHTANLFNVTIAYNVADDDQNNVGDGGGIFITPDSTVTMRNSLLGSNADHSTPGQYPNSHPHNCKGAITTYGYNLISNNYGCSGPAHNQNGDKVGNALFQIDPHIDSSASSYGTTVRVYALKSDSQAVDTANPNGCVDPDGKTLTTDQRGYVRPWNGGVNGVRCDMGAFEYNSAVPTAVPTKTPSPTATPSNPCQNKPAAPVLSKPTNNKTIQSTMPKLDWNDVTCATQYKVIVKRDSAKGVKAFKKTVAVSEVKTTALTKGHAYYWFVKACNAKGCAKSSTFMFNIKP